MHTSCRQLFAVLAVFVQVSAFPPPRALAEEAPPPLRHDIGAFALYGRSAVLLDGASSMPVRASVGSDGRVDMPVRTIADGEDSFVAAPAVTAADGSRLHFVYADQLEASPDVTLLHELHALGQGVVAAADYPRLPSVTCGDNDVSVDRTVSPLTLAPGRYGNLWVEQDQTLRLVPGGRYEFCMVRVRAGATIEAHAGNVVLVRDFLTTDAHSRITGDGACGARWIALGSKLSPAPASAGFEFTHRGGLADRQLIEGDFFTPGRISLGQNADYIGRFWADRIEGYGSTQIPRTVSDCRAPRCGDGVLDAGEACDDGNNLDGDCCSSFCEILPPGSSCDDHRFCTAHDACDASARCIGTGNPCDAPDGDGNCSEACNEETGACNGPDPDGTSCDDGIWCNGADLCASGACVSHSGPPCPGPDDDDNCNESCDELTHACNVRDPVGAPCNDGMFCTVGETCNAEGACDGGTPKCFAGDGDGDCAESCDELHDNCNAFDPAGAACDDGLFCTSTDSCDGRGSCVGWGDPCAGRSGDGDDDCSEACDEQNDSCSASDPDGAPCSDGLECTIGERCIAGTCAPGGMTSCDDSNPCTDEFCAPDGSCQRSYNSSACDDGNPCTTGDRCTAGECMGSGVVDCRDGDLCTEDVCDPADGTCHHSYAPASTCHTAGSSFTRIQRGYSDDGEAEAQLQAVWRSAGPQDPTAREEFADPSAGDPFAVCFYDESSGLPELAYRLDLDDSTLGTASWRRKGNFFGLLYRLKASSGTSEGVSYVRLGVDSDGYVKLRIKAGANAGCTSDCRSKFIPPAAKPGGRLFSMQPGMTIQWTSASGACWSSRYEDAQVNSSDAFQARSRGK